MHGSIMQLALAGYRCSLYLPPKYYEEEARAKSSGKQSELPKYPLVLLLGEVNIEPIINYVEERMSVNKRNHDCRNFIMLGIEVQEWERDFSPWRAEPLSKTTKTFTGHAKDFLNIIQKSMIPHLCNNYRVIAKPEYTAIVGYSLAGLCSLYSLYSSNITYNVASVSGSLWFKNWVDFCASENFPIDKNNKYNIYLSLGTSEKDTQNMIMSTVEDCTRRTFRFLQEKFKQAGKGQDSVFFEYTNGGHFDNVPKRIANAILYLEKE